MNKESGWDGESRGIKSLPGDNLVVDFGELLWYHLMVFPLWNGSWGARQNTWSESSAGEFHFFPWNMG